MSVRRYIIAITVAILNNEVQQSNSNNFACNDIITIYPTQTQTLHVLYYETDSTDYYYETDSTDYVLPYSSWKYL